MTIRKPQQKDLSEIEQLLSQWVNTTEVRKIIDAISLEFNVQQDTKQHFFVIEDENKVTGVGGLSPATEQLLSLASTNNPGLITLLYLDKTIRGKGYGSALLQFLEDEARKNGYTELFARSQGKGECVAYDFYGHKGYEHIATFEEDFASVVHRKII